MVTSLSRQGGRQYPQFVVAGAVVFRLASVGATVGTITITSPSAYQTFQRDSGNHASIPITISVANPNGTIEASWNGAAYVDLVATPSSGVNTGTLATQPAGQGTLTVRFKLDPTVSVTKAFVGIGDVYVVAGQSNGSGRGLNNQVYSHATLKAALFGNDYVWKELADPYDSNSGQVDSASSDAAAGSFVPPLATAVMAATGLPVAFVPTALGGSTVLQWAPGADHLNRATLYGSMNYRIGQVGGVKAVLWWQGETDALNFVDQATYNSRLDTFANAVFADRGVPVIAARLQNSSGIPDVDEAIINAAINEAVADNAHVKAGPDLTDLPSDDAYHLRTDAHLATAATRWWTAVAGATAQGGAMGGADLNTRLRTYLETFYSLTPPGDLTSMLARYLREEGSGDANSRFLALVGLAA